MLADKAVQFATAKTCVFSDSVLCMGGISQDLVRAWKEKSIWCMESRPFGGLDRIDGEPMEFEWNTVISVKQPSIYGAVADMCGESAWEVSRQ